MKFAYSDGGRAAAGYKGHAGDCTTRAIANATDLPYQHVYDEINEIAKALRKPKRGSHGSARTGVTRDVYHTFLTEHLGWAWVPTMKIGSGCTVHLRPDELPLGTLIVRVSKHITCVKNGVLYDTYDCTRLGTRCVYGYYYDPMEN